MDSDRQTVKLAGKAIRGNAKAYGQLIEYYKTYLYKTAFLAVKNQEKALDIVGECILKGFHSIHTLKNPEYFRTWLTRILMNTAKDYYYKNPEMDDIEDVEVAAPQAGISVEEKLDLYHAIDRLSEKYRTVIILRYFDEMKISEIAYTMNIPEGSVKAYLNRAKAELKKLLKEDDRDEDGISENRGTEGTGSGSGRQYGPYLYRAEA